MAATVLDMSVSVDGFIAGPNETVDHGLGDGGMRLHEWFFDTDDGGGRAAGPAGSVNRQLFDELMACGAIVAGRGTVEPADFWGGDHHDGIPIFILSRSEPDPRTRDWPLITYVDDVRTVMSLAKEAAGDKFVLVHGAGVARLALAAGVLDELELHVVPVLFGQGRRLFDGLAAEQIQLEPTRVLSGEHGMTHLHYRVVR